MRSVASSRNITKCNSKSIAGQKSNPLSKRGLSAPSSARSRAKPAYACWASRKAGLLRHPEKRPGEMRVAMASGGGGYSCHPYSAGELAIFIECPLLSIAVSKIPAACHPHHPEKARRRCPCNASAEAAAPTCFCAEIGVIRVKIRHLCRLGQSKAPPP